LGYCSIGISSNVLYLFGLNTEQNKDCKTHAPQIYRYQRDTEKGRASEDSVALNDTLFNSTPHRSTFIRDKKECMIANVHLTPWMADVQYQIQFLIITWMRQLQENFFEDKTIQLNTLGRYVPTTSPSNKDKRNPHTAIYFTNETGSDIKNMKRVRISKYTDVLQKKTVNKKHILCRSLEEWAWSLENTRCLDYGTKVTLCLGKKFHPHARICSQGYEQKKTHQVKCATQSIYQESNISLYGIDQPKQIGTARRDLKQYKQI